MSNNIIGRTLLKTKNPAMRKVFGKLFHRQIFDSFFDNNENKLDEPILTVSFDLDFREDVRALPGLLEQLKTFDIKADFACIGLLIKEFRREHRMITDYGHDVINHTFSHPWNDQINPDKRLDSMDKKDKMSEIKKCHEICVRDLNYAPTGFRMPHFGKMSPECMYPILKECGYSYSSSKVALDTPNAGLPYKTEEGVTEIPLSPCPKHPFGTLDSWHSLHSENTFLVKNHRQEFSALLKQLLEKGIERKTYINLYFDPMDVAKNRQFIDILEYAHEKRHKLKILTYEQALKRKDIMKKMRQYGR
jgi:peptidoglycan/xylan/chitin deacetylase (PgdA/CDA1 family)